MSGILPLLAPIPAIFVGFSVAGAYAGGAAGMAKTVQSKPVSDMALTKAGRHKLELEVRLRGYGLYLGSEIHGGCCPMCKGSCLYLGQKQTKTSEQLRHSESRGGAVTFPRCLHARWPDCRGS